MKIINFIFNINMYKYIFFVVLGILIYLYYNRNDNFSIGGLNINDICINYQNCNQNDGKECTGQCGCIDDESGIKRCLIIADSMVEDNKKILMDSYKICNPSMYDDILSLMRCMLDNGEISAIHCSMDGECHISRTGLNIVLDKYYNKSETKEYKWSELNELLVSNNHYIVECSILGYHWVYFLEFKDGKFRILSLWASNHGFLDFPFNSDGTSHRWAYFDGHENFDIFLNLLKTINGNIELDNSGRHNFEEYQWTSDELENSARIIRDIFNIQDFTMSDYGDKGTMEQPKVYEIERNKNIEQLMIESGLGYIYIIINVYLEEIGLDKNSTKDDLLELYEEFQETEDDDTTLKDILDLIDNDEDKTKFLNFIKAIIDIPPSECAAPVIEVVD